MSVMNEIKRMYYVLYSRSFMLLILILKSDTLLLKPISVQYKIPAYIFRDYDLWSCKFDSLISQLPFAQS